MTYIDITGPLSNDMWEWGHFPKIEIEEKHGFKEGFGDYSYTLFGGMHALAGTYIETPAHYVGYENSYLINQVPLERLVNVDCVVLHPELNADETGQLYVTREALEACENADAIQEGDAILVDYNWGDRMWFDQDHFPRCPYFTYDAFMWLLEKKPDMIGSDTSCWENLRNPSGFIPKFYESDILMLACLKNLAAVTAPRVKLTVLPLNVEGSCGSPCRAIITQE